MGAINVSNTGLNSVNGVVLTGGSRLTINHGPSRETEALKQKGYLETCQRYLDSPATSLKFNKIKKFPSAQWLIRHSSFQTWIQDSPLAFLTIRGNAFTGKSVLMRTAVEWNKENTSTITLYHFFNDAADGAITKLLQQLLGQLLAQVEELPREDIYRWSGDISGKRHEELCSPEALKESIKAIILANKRSLNEKETGIRIFVDGIDEHLDLVQGHDSTVEEMDEHCQPLRVLRLLWELLADTHSAGIDISVCVSRRHMLQYQGLDPPSVNIELEEYTDAEIERMLKSNLTCLADPKREDIILRLLKLTGTRNFCWAGHAVKEIMRLGADFQPDDVLQLIPAELKNHSDMYKHALAAQASDESRDQLHRLLQLRLGTMRPLTADEFRHAMAFAEGDHFRHESVVHWEEADRRRSAGKFPSLLHEASGGLLETVGPDPRGSGPSDPNNAAAMPTPDDEHIVMFTQHSVEHYLRGPKGLGELGADSAGALERTCDELLFRMGRAVLDHCKLRGRDKARILDYVLEYWLRHAQRCEPLPDDARVPELFEEDCGGRKARQFIKRQVSFLAEAQDVEILLLEDYVFGEDEDLDTDDLHMMVLLSAMGCKSLLRMHIRKCSVCDDILKASASDAMALKVYLDCLRAAAAGQHNDTAAYLLDLYPPGDVNVMSRGVSLLFRACYFASETEGGGGGGGGEAQLGLVRRLLELKADPCLRSANEYEYPINVAIALNNPALVRELLQPARRAAAVLRAQMKRTGWTALHFAVASRRDSDEEKLALVKLLRKLTPPGLGLLQIKDKEGNTPLQLAEKLDSDYGEDVVDEFGKFAKVDRVTVTGQESHVYARHPKRPD